MTWASRLAKLDQTNILNSESSESSDRGEIEAIGPIEPIGERVFSESQPANDLATAVPCTRCGTQSQPFIEVINADLWLCRECLPTDPIDQAMEAVEPVALIRESAS